MLVTCKYLNGIHNTNAQCAKGKEKKRYLLAAVEMREIAETAVQAYGRPTAGH